MNAVSSRLTCAVGALIAIVGCYSNNGGLIDADGGLGPGPDGGLGGSGGGAGSGGTGATGGSAGSGGGAGGSGGGAGSGGDAGSGGSGGNPLTGQWQAPLIIESHDGTGLNPQVSIGATGEAVSVWVQSHLGEHNVWANRYSPGSGWAGDLLIGTTDGNLMDPTETSQPDVVVDDDGVATAAWANYDDPIVRGLTSRRHTVPEGWADPETIYSGASTGGDARLTVDQNGNVMAAFSTGTGAWANYFQPAQGWGEAEIIDNEPNAPIGVQVALRPNGDGWAVWAQAPAGTPYNIFGVAFTAAVGWGEAAKVEDHTLGNAFAPQLAVSASGDALFVWEQTLGLALQVWSSGWDASGGDLTDPIRVDSAGTAYAPVVAMDPQGNATAVWLQSLQVSGNPLQVAASRYRPAHGWSPSQVLAEGNITSEPRVAMDSEGNAIVVYTEQVEQEVQADAWAHAYTGGAWSSAVRLGLDEPTGDAFQPSLAMSQDGTAVVVWREGPNIWASTFE